MTSAAGRGPRPDDARLLPAERIDEIRAIVAAPDSGPRLVQDGIVMARDLSRHVDALAVRVAGLEARATNAEADAERLAGHLRHALAQVDGYFDANGIDPVDPDEDEVTVEVARVMAARIELREALAGRVPAGGQDSGR